MRALLDSINLESSVLEMERTIHKLAKSVHSVVMLIRALPLVIRPVWSALAQRQLTRRCVKIAAMVAKITSALLGLM